MTKLEQILTRRLAHITERRLNTPIIEQQQMQRGSCKRIGQRYLVRLQDGTYTGAVSLKQAQKLTRKDEQNDPIEPDEQNDPYEQNELRTEG